MIKYLPTWDFMYNQINPENQDAPRRSVDFIQDTELATGDTLVYISFGFAKDENGVLMRRFEYKNSFCMRRISDVFQNFEGLKLGYAAVLLSALEKELDASAQEQVDKRVSGIAKDIEWNQKILRLPTPATKEFP